MCIGIDGCFVVVVVAGVVVARDIINLSQSFNSGDKESYTIGLSLCRIIFLGYNTIQTIYVILRVGDFGSIGLIGLSI